MLVNLSNRQRAWRSRRRTRYSSRCRSAVGDRNWERRISLVCAGDAGRLLGLRGGVGRLKVALVHWVRKVSYCVQLSVGGWLNGRRSCAYDVATSFAELRAASGAISPFRPPASLR